MRFWRRRDEPAQGSSGDDTNRRRMEIVHAQRRLEDVERRAGEATAAILRRHSRNHWTETIRRIVKGD